MTDVADLNRPIPWVEVGDDAAWWRAEVERRARRLVWLQDEPDPYLRAQRLAADAELCRRSDEHWIQQYAWMYNPHGAQPWERLTPVVLWPDQLRFSAWLDERTEAGDVAIVPKGRKLGVSWICLLKIQRRWLFEHNFSALVGSRKQELVDRRGDRDSLFGKLRWNLGRQPAHLMPRSYVDNMLVQVNHDHDAEIAGEATNPAWGQGKRRTIAMIDEAARIDAPIFASTWIAAESVMRSLWVVYNPGAEAHMTWQLHKGPDALPERCIFEMDWTADPRRDEAWKAGKIRPRGRLTEQEFKSAYELQYGYVLTGQIWDVVRDRVEYHEDHPDWRDKAERVKRISPHIGGWDYGSGASLLVCFFGMLEMGLRPVLWIDDERVWSQTAWQTAAAEAVAVMSRYGDRRLHVGDPAGSQRESDQMSWESNLRSGGVPLISLDAWFNTQQGFEWTVKLVQTMLDDGRIRIHRRCRYLLQVVTGWRRNIPDGLEVDMVSKAYIGPDKGQLSHGGDALRYLAAGAALVLAAERAQAGRPAPDSDLPEIPHGPASSIIDALRRR